jgi:hypothetical protein
MYHFTVLLLFYIFLWKCDLFFLFVFKDIVHCGRKKFSELIKMIQLNLNNGLSQESENMVIQTRVINKALYDKGRRTIILYNEYIFS